MKVKNAVGQHGLILPEVDLICEKIRRLFIATMRERIHGLWGGLLQMCGRGTMRDRWFVANMRESIHGVWLVCHRCARNCLQGLVGLSQACEKPSAGCGWSVADMQEGFRGIWHRDASYCVKKLCTRCARRLTLLHDMHLCTRLKHDRWMICAHTPGWNRLILVIDISHIAPSPIV